MPYKITNFGGKPVCDFLLVNNSNLHAVLHHFQDIDDYCSNFHCLQEVPLFKPLILSETLNSGL